MEERSDPIKIACHNVWKIYGANPARFFKQQNQAPIAEVMAEHGYIGAVRDASFEVRSGEILVVMGLSGSGKSTIVRCLTMLTAPTAGQILFEDRDLLDIPERDLIELRRHKMGMVFQQFGLFPHRTVIDNVAFPLEVRGEARAKRTERAQAQIEMVGLEGREHYYPGELSGGQQQRVGIARSLVADPDVWFLDEPFSALDPLIRRDMQDEFLRIQGSLKKTIVFITHDFDEAIKLADRIVIMKDGEIVQIGRPADLVMTPATDYVAQFTRDVSRAKVLTVGAVAEAADTGIYAPDGVRASDTLEHAAPRIIQSTSPVPVIDDDGQTVGMLSRDHLLDILYGPDATARPRQEAIA